MIATLLGPKKFKAGMDLYFKRHDGDAATIVQFLACFEKAGKADLAQFALWYSQAGTPLLNASTKYDKARGRLEIEFEQFLRPTPGQRRKAPMHIPQSVSLIGPDGNSMTASKITGADFEDGILHLTKRTQKVSFNSISERPVVGLNRGFTAPVDVNYRQTASYLAFLALHETDGFARWQAYQNFANRLMIAGLKNIRSGSNISVDQKFLDVARQIASDTSLDPAFRAAMLTLPGEGELAQTIGKNVDPDVIQKS